MKHSLSFCFLPFINNRGENSFSLNFSCLCFPFLVVFSCLSFSIKVVAHSFQLIHNGAQELKTFSLVPPFLLLQYCLVWWTECFLSSASYNILYHQQQSNKTARVPPKSLNNHSDDCDDWEETEGENWLTLLFWCLCCFAHRENLSFPPTQKTWLMLMHFSPIISTAFYSTNETEGFSTRILLRNGLYSCYLPS